MIRYIVIALLFFSSTRFANSQTARHDQLQSLLLVEGRVPKHILVTTMDMPVLGESIPTEFSAAGAILAMLKPAEIVRWRREMTHAEPLDDAHPSRPRLYLHLVRDDLRRRLSLIEASEDSYVVTDEELYAHVPSDAVEIVLRDAPLFRGSRKSAPFECGRSILLPHPYVPSPIQLSAGRMNQRIYRGMNVEVRSADRTLARESMHVRLPRDYDPANPTGLMVWASPSRNGGIPLVFHSALDDLNIVAIGVDNAGNARGVPEKFQLMFDAVATAQRRFNIDPDRITIAGMSGGGKVASVLTLCFPEVFRGAVCMAGVGTPHELDESWQQHSFAYCRPTPESLAAAKGHPLALVVGPADFNYAEMKRRHELLVRDSFEHARFFDYEDLGHHLPTSDQFREALRYVNDATR